MTNARREQNCREQSLLRPRAAPAGLGHDALRRHSSDGHVTTDLGKIRAYHASFDEWGGSIRRKVRAS